MQGVYLGCLLALGDEEIVLLTMPIEGARNFPPCLGFSCPWGRKSMGTPSAEDWPEALESGIPAQNSGSLSPAKAVKLCCASWDPALSPGVAKSPPSRVPRASKIALAPEDFCLVYHRISRTRSYYLRDVFSKLGLLRVRD